MTTRAVSLMTMAVGLLAGSTAAAAQNNGRGTTGPVIDNYGPVFDVAGLTFQTDASNGFKAVFDVAAAPERNDVVNSRIETVARFLNMHARGGVPAERMEVALVLHGGSGKYALRHAAYRERFGVNNPNLDLIDALSDAGVQIILCGQTASYRGFAGDELDPSVDVALSAMTALVVLQSQGYALIAF